MQSCTVKTTSLLSSRTCPPGFPRPLLVLHAGSMLGTVIDRDRDVRVSPGYQQWDSGFEKKKPNWPRGSVSLAWSSCFAPTVLCSVFCRISLCVASTSGLSWLAGRMGGLETGLCHGFSAWLWASHLWPDCAWKEGTKENPPRHQPLCDLATQN